MQDHSKSINTPRRKSNHIHSNNKCSHNAYPVTISFRAIPGFNANIEMTNVVKEALYEMIPSLKPNVKLLLRLWKDMSVYFTSNWICYLA